MDLKAALHLCYWQNSSTLTRIRYDFGREIVLMFSSATLLGLFFYIFKDFLQEKIAHLPSQGALVFALLAAVLVLGGPWIGARIAELLGSEASWRNFATRCGEKPSTLRLFLGLQTSFMLLIFYGCFWKGIVPAFKLAEPYRLWPWQGLSLLLAALRVLFGPKQSAPSALTLKPILNDEPTSRRKTLVLWRWYQLVRRHQLARLCMGLIAGLWVLLVGLAYSAWPPFLLILVSLLASILLAAAVAFQLEEDMRFIWFERQLGCSHEEYVAVYQQLCLALGLSLALALGLPLALLQPSIFWSETWKVLPIAALCPLLLPSVMFQLAPDRSLLQILVIALLGLFVGTAIYAHALGLLLVPLVIYYAKQYQKDNFYRS